MSNKKVKKINYDFSYQNKKVSADYTIKKKEAESSYVLNTQAYHNPAHLSYQYNWVKGTEEQFTSDFVVKRNHYYELYDDYLGVYKEGTYKKIPLERLRGIKLQSKVLAFPLIAGGIIAPLLFMCVHHEIVPYFWGLPVVLAAIFLIYFGVTGSYQMTIDEAGVQEHFLIGDKERRARLFIQEVLSRRNVVLARKQ